MLLSQKSCGLNLLGFGLVSLQQLDRAVLFIRDVKDTRLGLEFGIERLWVVLLHHLRDLGIGIVQIAKDACSAGAGCHASGRQPLSTAIRAEIALIGRR